MLMTDPMPPHQKCVDLSALADLLKEEKLYPALEKIIRRFHGKVSVKTDLDSAWRSLESLHCIMMRNQNPLSISSIDLASGEGLCLHAVVVYCRAFVSKGSGRFGTSVLFTDELKEAHARIAGLRNRRFCHYETSEDIHEASWSDDRAVAVFSDNYVYLRFASSRRGWDRRVFDDLRLLIGFALPIVERKAKDEADKLFDELMKCLSEPQFVNIAKRALFEPRKFFASIEQADSIASSSVIPFDGVRFGVLTE